MRVVAIIQARMRSTRLPGKVLKQLQGKTVLEHGIIRIQSARMVDDVVVATSDLTVDDAVVAEAARAGAKISRGSEQDVLSRYYHAARQHAADVIVRMTSDCPLFDPELLDRMLVVFLEALAGSHPYDYFSNTLRRRTFPTGLDAEIFTMAALERAFQEGERPLEREHVTPYLYQNPGIFRLGGLESEVDNSRYRWTLDTAEDLELIDRIYQALYREDRLFTTDEVLRLMADQPELAAINGGVTAKAVDRDRDHTRTGPLVVRVDASRDIGSGHLMRCLALAQAWPLEAGPVMFVMAEGEDAFGSRLRAEGYTVRAIEVEVGSTEDAAATLTEARNFGTGWLVLDGYRFGGDYLASVAAGSSRVLVVDDCGRADLPAVDLLLNQNLHGAAELYPGRSPSTGLLLGLDHVLLRREFLTVPPGEPLVPQEARRILVTLGGGDPDNFSGLVLEALGQTGIEGLAVRLLVGASNPHVVSLEKMAADLPARVQILSGVDDMPGQYRWADLAITGGGSTLWELAFMGVPALTFILADNQEPSSRLLDQQGVIVCLGRPGELSRAGELSWSDLARTVAGLSRDSDRRAALARAGRKLIDGRGARRVTAAMAELSRREATA